MNKNNEEIILAPENINSLYKELKLIQNNIKRMASNSFLIKGWAVTLVVGSLLLKVTDLQLILPFIPIISFWSLDTYFLYQERKFRDLYNWVVKCRPKSQKFLFDMSFDRFKETELKKKTKFIISTFFSKNLLLFYLPILIVVITYLILTSL